MRIYRKNALRHIVRIVLGAEMELWKCMFHCRNQIYVFSEVYYEPGFSIFYIYCSNPKVFLWICDRSEYCSPDLYCCSSSWVCGKIFAFHLGRFV